MVHLEIIENGLELKLKWMVNAGGLTLSFLVLINKMKDEEHIQAVLNILLKCLSELLKNLNLEKSFTVVILLEVFMAHILSKSILNMYQDI
jgi:hypothetical protein